jgi:hypothetical protein
MNYPMQPIIQHLFQASSLEDVSRQRLETFVAEYPSFGIGHYLLSRKLQAEGSDSYQEETQKTNLYFTNPFWLQLLLESPQDDGAQVSTTPVRPRPEFVASSEEPEDVAATTGAEPFTPTVEPEHVASTTEPELFTPSVEPEIVVSSIEPVKDTMDNVVEESLFNDHPQSMVSLAEAVVAAEEPTAAQLLLQSIEEAKGLRDSLQKMNEDFGIGKPLPEAEERTTQPIEAEQAIPPITAEQTEQPIKDEEAPFVLDEDVMPVAMADSSQAMPGPAMADSSEAMQEPAPAEAPSLQSSSIATTLAAASATLSTPVPAAEQTFVFEPYHTIDYFASQGIKLTLDDNPSDQLGKQLKSFTDWLKVMRRLPQKEREIIPDRAAEQTVQTIAAHSVVGREIVTETMAEVLAKQGMPERARAVYEKLSLLNPDKRAYFATKIEQLNSL